MNAHEYIVDRLTADPKLRVLAVCRDFDTCRKLIRDVAYCCNIQAYSAQELRLDEGQRDYSVFACHPGNPLLGIKADEIVLTRGWMRDYKTNLTWLVRVAWLRILPNGTVTDIDMNDEPYNVSLCTVPYLSVTMTRRGRTNSDPSS